MILNLKTTNNICLPREGGDLFLNHKDSRFRGKGSVENTKVQNELSNSHFIQLLQWLVNAKVQSPKRTSNADFSFYFNTLKTSFPMSFKSGNL